MKNKPQGNYNRFDVMMKYMDDQRLMSHKPVIQGKNCKSQ